MKTIASTLVFYRGHVRPIDRQRITLVSDSVRKETRLM